MSAEKAGKIYPEKKNQKGTATIIAVMIMSLMVGFVSLAVTRTTNETISIANDIAESRSFAVSQASIENMTLRADAKLESKLNLDSNDINEIKNDKPTGFTGYVIDQNLRLARASEIVDATGEDFQGLKSIRDEWELTSNVLEERSGVRTIMRRRFYNNRVPLFQFGIFGDDDLEFHPGPKFAFGGRVHSNGNLYLMASTGLYFNSKVSTSGQVITEVARNGHLWSNWNNNVFIKNGAGVNTKIDNNMGSVRSTVVNGPNVFASDPDMPPLYRSANWSADVARFDGNLSLRDKKLNLPLKINTLGGNSNFNYFELIRRGKNLGDKFNNGTGTAAAPSIVNVDAATKDTTTVAQQRYYNGTGIRVSLADSKNKLPGCATTGGDCGIRLDGDDDGDGGEPGGGNARGYWPRQLTNGQRATRVNGERLTNVNLQNWIKIELVRTSAVNSEIEAFDVTEDILALGVTESFPFVASASTRDGRSIIKLQRYTIAGDQIRATSNYISDYLNGTTRYNVVMVDDGNVATLTDDINFNTSAADHQDHRLDVPGATFGLPAASVKIVPFPITMFDTREGLHNDNLTISTAYPAGALPRNGVMSIVDIDVNNLRRFLNGEFDTLLPTNTPYAASKGNISLKAADVPSKNGYIMYVSDRRGDFDYDGEYDMEDIYGDNDGIKQPGEDVNKNGTLQAEYINEAVRYSQTVSPDIAAVINPKFFRRGVRLINGQVLPGRYELPPNSQDTKGFTFATENGVYVKGNYNATGVASVNDPTPSSNYLPQNTTDHIPASVVADAVTILSNSWNDSKSFRNPFVLSGRVASETTIRFAMLAGDTLSSLDGTPNQGGGDPRLAGGVHNFKRFMENWSGVRLNYSGSLINMFNSHNNNGAFKCCAKVYSPPTRNWVFDTTFLDANRLPPGTPFFQYIKLTGFERVND